MRDHWDECFQVAHFMMMKFHRQLLLFSLILLLVLFSSRFSHAQDSTAQPTPTEPGLDYGISASGTLGDAESRLVYNFDGLRGEFISLTLRVTSGNLDPVLLMMDEQGQVLTQRDDSAGGRDIVIESLRIPQTARFFVIIGRFGYELGTTSGAFELTIERIGVSFADGSGLRYGDTVLNQITDLNPRLYYTFRAERGDIISLRMQRTSGNLDAALQLVDSQGVVIAENDEIEGSGSLDAAIVGYTIDEDGTYVIIATRYGQVAGSSSGSFVLSLESGAQSGLGASLDFAIPIGYETPYQSEITAERVQEYYRIEGAQFDRISINMNREGGALDTFLVLTDDQQNELASDDDTGGGQNAAILDFVLPYDGVFYIIATRYQRGAGTSVGPYTLSVRNLGNVFDGVPGDIQRINYGSSAVATLDDLVPRVLLAFYGRQGETITITMANTGGDLDPVIGLLNANQQLLVSDDNSGGGVNALIERYTLPQTGIYYIQAARYEGADRPATRGSFMLVLAQRFD